MKQTKTMLRLELEAKPEMDANCQLAAMAPMTAMAAWPPLGGVSGAAWAAREKRAQKPMRNRCMKDPYSSRALSAVR